MFDENIKKGLKLAAIGFLFTLVNFNLDFGNGSINLMPNFVGWILFFLTFDKFGEYTKDSSLLKYGALTLAVLEGAFWAMAFAAPDINITVVKTVVNLAQAAWTFLYFGILVEISEDFNSRHTGTLNYLKYLNLILYIMLNVVAVFYSSMDLAAFAGIFTVIGVAALVAAIWTAVILFKLEKEVRNM
jgi:hypothetical protein